MQARTFTLVFGLLAVTALSTAVTVSRLHSKQQPPPPSTPPARPIETAPWTPPAPAIEQHEVPDEPEPPDPPDRPRKTKKRLPRPPEQKPAELSVEETAQNLLEQARRLREEKPEHAMRIDQLIADTLLWSRATDRDKAKHQLESIARELETFE